MNQNGLRRNAITGTSNWLKNVLRSNDKHESAILFPHRTLLGFHYIVQEEVSGDSLQKQFNSLSRIPGGNGDSSYTIFSP